ncbi:MAG: hypothetical protein AAF205_08920 [Pseudomonadota bacterium]
MSDLDHIHLKRPLRARKPAWRKWTELSFGVILCILAPPIGGLAPGPLGFAGFALGLTLILRNSRWAKRRYIWFRRRWPKWGRRSDWLLRRRPRRVRPKPREAGNDRLGSRHA